MKDKGEEQILLSTAEHFRNAAISLKENIPLGEIPIGLFLPPAVNAAFAVELYIKYLLYKQGWVRKRSDKHDLKSLFNQLEENIRFHIRLAVYQHYKHHHPEMNFDFDSKLEENKNVFHECRYMHEFISRFENKGVDYGFLMNFCIYLKAAANRY